MFFELINPDVKYLFVPFVNGEPLLNVSFLFWLFYLIGVLLSVTIHEYFHAFIAYKKGDKTAYLLGRMNLNPFNHFDILGLALIMFTGIGYGKPIPVDLNNLNSKKDIFYVTVAGPISNVLLALVLGLIYILLNNTFKYYDLNSLSGILLSLVSTIIHTLPAIGVTNLGLAIFNMLPFYPLDGSRIWGYIHPSVQMFLEKYIFPYSIFLIILFILPIFGNLSLVQIITIPFVIIYSLFLKI